MLVIFSCCIRHTWFDCDWSSDVCSSDLPRHEQPQPQALGAAGDEAEGGIALEHRVLRSEERRVGIEMFQTFISRHNSNFFSDKLVLTSVTPASSAPVLQTPKATSSTLYFDSLTVNAGYFFLLHTAYVV